ncbi:MAG: hypothetical protein HZB29_10260 [Nitrospinae bacterium]|nr:hypothetical protein [Nitrospinota bacterium]
MKVHYDNADPAVSFLEVSMPDGAELVIFTGILVMAGGFVGWLSSVRK